MSKRFQIIILFCCLAFVGCNYQSTADNNHTASNSNQATESPIKSPSPTSESSPAAIVRPILKITPDGVPIVPDNPDSPIRKIDFENFTYPWPKGYEGANSAYPGKYFKLKNGELPHRIFRAYP